MSADSGGSHVPGLILVFTMIVLPFGFASRSALGIVLSFVVIAVCTVVAALALCSARRKSGPVEPEEDDGDAVDWRDGL